MGDTSLRPETHSEETELQKVTDYLKCYELLSKDCINKFNETYLQEYNEYHKGNDELHSDYFMITKLYDINEVNQILIPLKNFFFLLNDIFSYRLL
jgi:hypothetical protein